jgi:hypothetical protein
MAEKPPLSADKDEIERLLDIGFNATREVRDPRFSFAESARRAIWLKEGDAEALGAHDIWQLTPWKEGDKAWFPLTAFAGILKDALTRRGFALEIDLGFFMGLEGRAPVSEDGRRTVTLEDFELGRKAFRRALDSAWQQLHPAVFETPADREQRRALPGETPKKEHGRGEPSPDGIRQAIFRLLWHLPWWVKWPVIILGALVAAAYAFCALLPETAKQGFLDWIRHKP